MSRICDGLQKLADQHGNIGMVVHYGTTQSDVWVCGLEFGREAPDSPMVGGAAYGSGNNAHEAIVAAFKEAGITFDD